MRHLTTLIEASGHGSQFAGGSTRGKRWQAGGDHSSQLWVSGLWLTIMW